jgi:membrane associated rhomboid family serine protease
MNVSSYLLAAIGIMFVLQMVVPPLTDALILDPLLAFIEPWRLITSIFLHGGFTHIFFNAYALFMFGSLLEMQVGKKEYLAIFFGAGLIGSLLYIATFYLGIIPPIPALGASGAIYGILGAVAVLLPDLKIFFWFFPMKIRYAAILWVAFEFFGTFDISSGVASAAHLGGLLFGIVFALYLKRNGQRHVRQTWEWTQGTE